MAQPKQEKQQGPKPAQAAASAEMSFAQALNEAKGVILQLSGRVKTDAEKIRTQQQTIVSQSATIAQHDMRIEQQEVAIAAAVDEVTALQARVREADAAREHAEAILNRQGEKIQSLVAANGELEARLAEHKAQIAQVSRERDELRAQMPTADDAAALASMAALLTKAAPAIEKAKRAATTTTGGAPQMRIAGRDDAGEDAVAEAA
ncbi:MAG TPA: hypothetical protein VH475_07300 [Tepidisphaeraceae bacterium]|jgi:chromosome segregation ATPase